MKLIVAYDTSVFIDRSINSVFETIGEAIVLVVLVIYFFLRSLRATLIPIITIPVSLIGTFGLMYLFGFTINTLSLLAIVLAIGLVVDDAIVMLENIFRHVEEGMPRREAAILGAREIGFAIIAMTLTLASVFAPLAFATGRTGRLFIEFALTLAGAVMVSGFVALTLSPMMCSLLLKHQERHSWIYNTIEGWLTANDQRIPASAHRHAARALDGGAGLGGRPGTRRRVLRHAEGRAGADRGPRRRVRARHRAAGLDANLCRRPDPARSRRSTRRFPRPPPSRRSRAFRRSSTATRSCA